MTGLKRSGIRWRKGVGYFKSKGFFSKKQNKICTDKSENLPNNSKKLKEFVECGTDVDTEMSQTMTD